MRLFRWFEVVQKGLPAAPRLRASWLTELPNHWPPRGSAAALSFKRNKIKLIRQKIDKPLWIIDVDLEDPCVRILIGAPI